MWVYLIPEKLLWKKSNHGSQEERLVDLSYRYAREYGSKGRLPSLGRYISEAQNFAIYFTSESTWPDSG